MGIFCFLLFVILFASFSQAAEPAPAESLPPMVVTATRTEVPLNQLTTSLTVITAEDIRERQAELVSEVLRDVAGVNVVQTRFYGHGHFGFHSRLRIKSGAGHDRRR